MNNPEDKKILGLIAAKFKTIRTEQGLSQRKLALIAKMEYNQVQKLEKGESNRDYFNKCVNLKIEGLN